MIWLRYSLYPIFSRFGITARCIIGGRPTNQTKFVISCTQSGSSALTGLLFPSVSVLLTKISANLPSAKKTLLSSRILTDFYSDNTKGIWIHAILLSKCRALHLIHYVSDLEPNRMHCRMHGSFVTSQLTLAPQVHSYIHTHTPQLNPRPTQKKHRLHLL